MIPRKIRCAGLGLLLLTGALASMAAVRFGSVQNPDICYVDEVVPWTRNPSGTCGGQTPPTHQLSTSHVGGQDCTMSWTVTLSGTCTNGTGTGIWGLIVNQVTATTTGTALPNLNPSPSSLGAIENGISCDPGSSSGRVLESKLYEGNWLTGTFRDGYAGAWACAHQ